VLGYPVIMPKPPLPAELDEFLSAPNPSVIATLQPDGSPHTAATWYLWEGGRVLVNMDEGRKRLDYLRVEIDEDGLDDIDRLSRHYTGEPYHQRERGRVSAWIEVDLWHAWVHGKPWAG
jgi:hypothetical protein